MKGHPEDSALNREEERTGEKTPYQYSFSPSLDCSHIKSRGPFLVPLVDWISLMRKSTRSSTQLFIKQFRTGDYQKGQHQPDLKDGLRSRPPSKNFNRIFKMSSLTTICSALACSLSFLPSSKNTGNLLNICLYVPFRDGKVVGAVPVRCGMMRP